MKVGFINAYCNKPGKKYYSYHGSIRDCLIQPDPDPFDDFPADVPYGPTQYMLFTCIYIDGYYKLDEDYNVAHGAAAGNSYLAFVGQNAAGTPIRYSMYRSGIAFDTVALPDEAKIVSGIIKLRIQATYGNMNFEVVIRYGMPTFPHLYEAPGDYYIGNYHGIGGSTVYPRKDRIIFNEDGCSWVNKFGISKFGVLSTKDINKVWPTGNEVVYYKSGPGFHFLEVGYKLPL